MINEGVAAAQAARNATRNSDDSILQDGLLNTAKEQPESAPNKRQNTRRAYAAGNGDRKPYGGPKPLCSKTYGQRRYKTKFLTLGSSSSVFEEEEWYLFRDVH
ncbi:hypothetical protein Tco_1139487 [Tanacetum coccineum]